MRNKIFILLGSIFLLFVSCEKTHISLKSKERRLTDKVWRVDSYVDHTLNECIDPESTKYVFEEDGSFVVTKYDSVSHYSTWNLDKDNEYLTIGNNTFKLVLVTNKILSLRYGELDVFFIPVKD